MERYEEVEHPSRQIISKLISRLLHHKQYERIFEQFYLKVTREFYITESKQLRETLGAQPFIMRCEQRDTQERQRCEAMLPARSWVIVQDTALKALLDGRLDWLAKNGTS